MSEHDPDTFSPVSGSVVRGEFERAFTRVWEMTVGLPLGPEAPAELVPGDRWISGVVWLGGRWTGSVTLMIPASLARLSVGRMLDESPESLDDDQLRDGVRELTNMTAGNLKSSLPGPAGLAIPGCVESETPHDFGMNFRTLLTLRFSIDGRPLITELHALLDECDESASG